MLPGSGILDVENNAIHVVRSLSLRLSHSILNHCFLGPLETTYRRAGSSATKSMDTTAATTTATNSNTEEGDSLHNNSGETKNQTTQDNANSLQSSSTTSSLLWSVLNDFSTHVPMKTMRVLLQTHYNIAGRVQRLIDARVLQHDAFQPLAALIFEDAPIPIEIMEDELSLESDIDVILRESKDKIDARASKTRGNAKQRLKKDKKGYVQNDWMQDEDETTYGMGDSSGRSGSSGGRRKIDKQLHAAMRAIMSKYDEDDDMDDTLDSMTSSLRMRSDLSAYSDEEGEGEDEREEIEILEVTNINGVSTGFVRNAEGKKVQVLMPNMNRSATISANSRGRGRKRGGGSNVDTRKCFNCGGSGHLSNECPQPRLTGSERGKIKKEKKEAASNKKNKGTATTKNNNSKGISGGGSGNAKGTGASSERQRKRNEKNKSSRANHNRKTGALKKASKGM